MPRAAPRQFRVPPALVHGYIASSVRDRHPGLGAAHLRPPPSEQASELTRIAVPPTASPLHGIA